MRKSQTTTINIFLLLLLDRKIYILSKKHIWINLVWIVTFVLPFFCMAGYWKCSNKTPAPILMCIDLVDAMLWPKILSVN